MNQRWRKPCFDWLWLLAECIAKKRGSGVVYDPQNLKNSSLSPHKVLTYLHLNSRARRTLVRCFPSYKLFLVFYHIILMISNIPVQHWNHVLLTVPSNLGQDIRDWLRIEAMICFRVRLHRGMSSYCNLFISRCLLALGTVPPPTTTRQDGLINGNVMDVKCFFF